VKFVKEYRRGGELIALLVKREFQEGRPAKHATFVSMDNQSLQLGIGNYPSGLVAPRHTHRKVRKAARYEELIHQIRGRMKVELYGKDKVKFASFVMRPGDTVQFMSGGHGFKMLGPCKCLEIKQGPYSGKINKEVF